MIVNETISTDQGNRPEKKPRIASPVSAFMRLVLKE
jgi:hypothetical protein